MACFGYLKRRETMTVKEDDWLAGLHPLSTPFAPIPLDREFTKYERKDDMEQVVSMYQTEGSRALEILGNQIELAAYNLANARAHAVKDSEFSGDVAIMIQNGREKLKNSLREEYRNRIIHVLIDGAVTDIKNAERLAAMRVGEEPAVAPAVKVEPSDR